MSARRADSEPNRSRASAAGSDARARGRWAFAQRQGNASLRRAQPILVEREEAAARWQPLMHRQHPG